MRQFHFRTASVFTPKARATSSSSSKRRICARFAAQMHLEMEQVMYATA